MPSLFNSERIKSAKAFRTSHDRYESVIISLTTFTIIFFEFFYVRNMFTLLVVVVVVSFALRIVWSVVKYHAISRKIVSLPRLQTKLPILQMFQRADSYEKTHFDFFDDNDTPFKVIRGVKYVFRIVLYIRELAITTSPDCGFLILMRLNVS